MLAAGVRGPQTARMTTTAQTWVLLGILGVLVSGLLVSWSVAFSSLRGEMRGLFAGLRAEMGARFDVVDARFVAVDARFAAVDTRFDGVDRRLDDLDRDVQALSDRVFRDRP